MSVCSDSSPLTHSLETDHSPQGWGPASSPDCLRGDVIHVESRVLAGRGDLHCPVAWGFFDARDTASGFLLRSLGWLSRRGGSPGSGCSPHYLMPDPRCLQVVFACSRLGADRDGQTQQAQVKLEAKRVMFLINLHLQLKDLPDLLNFSRLQVTVCIRVVLLSRTSHKVPGQPTVHLNLCIIRCMSDARWSGPALLSQTGAVMRQSAAAPRAR